jgi:NAD(P)-dependent dehydrogenase (short-subunit alcohol dehydrogenase family)
MSNAERVAAITGGTSGIGREVARKLAQAGAVVAVAGRNEAEGAETVRLIEADGGTAWFNAVDVSDTAAVERWVNDVHGPAGLAREQRGDERPLRAPGGHEHR